MRGFIYIGGKRQLFRYWSLHYQIFTKTNKPNKQTSNTVLPDRSQTSWLSFQATTLNS